MQIVLASSSRYRAKLLEQVNIFAQCQAPNIDESPIDQEHPKAQALRLAIAKTHAIASKHPNNIVIGSDQVASLKGMRLEKPGNYTRAFEQLQAQAGHTVLFYSAVCAYKGQTLLSDVVTTEVEFRALDAQEIKNYLLQEQPYDCAGSFKSEGLGISLFNRISSDDPSALIGLPLIKTLSFLRMLKHCF